METTKRYSATGHETQALGFDTHLVSVPGSDRRFVLPTPVKDALGVCRTSDTLEGLAQRTLESLGLHGEEREWAESTIEDLRQMGLVVPIENLLPRTRESSSVSRPVTSVAFVTADRPQELKRALNSYAENLKTHERKIEFVVMDDSKSERARSSYLESLEHPARDFPVRYAGLPEREAYLEELARCGIDPEIARFGLIGDWREGLTTAGANRNCVLLDTIGEHLLSADDDTTCNLVSHPERKLGVQFTGDLNPREFWFFEDREALSQATEWEACDLLSEHERILGKTLVDIVSQVPLEEIRFDNICNHMLSALGHDGQSQVVATVGGIIGDCGGETASWLLTASGPTRKRLLESEDLFRMVLQSREVLGVASSSTITHSPVCKATTLGLANCDLLPPFFPVGRNQDAIFGLLVSLAAPAAFLGHIPVAVFHDPSSTRKYNPLPAFRISELIISLLAPIRGSRPRGVAELLHSAGDKLLDTANLDDTEFAETVFRAMSSREAEHLRSLEFAMRDFGGFSSQWQELVTELHDGLASGLAAPDCCTPAEFKQIMPAETCWGNIRTLVGRAGHFFRMWTDICAAARQLREKGIRVSLESSGLKR